MIDPSSSEEESEEEHGGGGGGVKQQHHHHSRAAPPSGVHSSQAKVNHHAHAADSPAHLAHQAHATHHATHHAARDHATHTQDAHPAGLDVPGSAAVSRSLQSIINDIHIRLFHYYHILHFGLASDNISAKFYYCHRAVQVLFNPNRIIHNYNILTTSEQLLY